MAKKPKLKLNREVILGLASVFAIAAIIALIIIFYPSGSSTASAAFVNGKVITMAELDRQYGLVPSQYRSFITKESLLDGMINEELLLQEAALLGISVSDDEVNSLISQSLQAYGMTEEDFVSLVEQQGLTVSEAKESFRKKLLISRLLNITFAGANEVSADEARDYYESNPELFSDGATAADFEDVKGQIISVLQQEKESALFDAYIASLREGADIQVFFGESGNAQESLQFEITPVSGSEEKRLDGSVSEPSLASFAECLSSRKAVLYGAGWSSNTQSQISLFGDAFGRIEYVSCDGGKCKELGITSYPTWIIGGAKYAGEKSLAELSSLTGCRI